ncbi:toxin HicA [Enterococcus sp. JM4C]|uniref:type II toxin-antitoxin system HicA family toxin n=1 Tax=Candidatus Enterococcus huntleyi TaxID=1857217 RepID=UPI00137AC2BD|nr:type II toxin-antitoxin system HicA family toxin [Enterococcus sp. JM4C]KAF1297325.1 toxin HicA [Enterococcus sp. JM4C]
MPKTAREVLKILKKNGFIKINQNGSHIKMYNPKTNKTAIVPIHIGDIPLGTERNIWKQANLNSPRIYH